MADEQPAKKKRRLRPASETVREKAVKAAEPARPKKTSKALSGLGRSLRPLGFIFRPLRWVGRHLVPRYFKQAFNELRNITWPNRKQARQLTTAVVLFAIVFGALVSVLDLGLDKVFKKVFLHE